MSNLLFRRYLAYFFDFKESEFILLLEGVRGEKI